MEKKIKDMQYNMNHKIENYKKVTSNENMFKSIRDIIFNLEKKIQNLYLHLRIEYIYS